MSSSPNRARLAETAGSWRVAIRLARRAAGRAKARTALIVLMLALPVYAGTLLAMSYTATYTSADAEASWQLGRADYEIHGPVAGSALATLPEGAQVTRVTYGHTVLGLSDGYRLREYAAADVDAALTEGMFRVRDGRAPRGAGEVAVSASLAAGDAVRIGDRLEIGLPPRPRTVVGIVDAARELSLPLVVSPADQPLSAEGPHTLVRLPAGAGWRPPDPAEHMVCESPGQSCSSGFSARYRPDLRPGQAELATRAAALVLVIGFAGTQVALLAGAAFAIGARRQRRELALLGAVGAGRPQIARLVLAHGLVLGAVAGVGGVLLGAATYGLNRDLVERVADHPLGASGVPVLWLSGIALFAVAVGLIAAFGPARGAARESLRGALAGREQTSRAGTLRWLAGGLLTAGAGAAGAVVAAGSAGSVVAVAVGTVAVLLGVTAFAPVAVAVVGWCASRLPLAARLAVRHAARHRLRTAAAVAAVCTAIAGSMALMFYGAADGADQGPGGQPNARTGQVLLSAEAAARLTPEQLHAVESVLPARATLPITAVTPEAGTRPSMRPGDGAVLFPSQLVAVGGAELVRAVTGAEPAPDVTAALRAGKAVAFYPELIFDGHLRIGPDVRIPAVLALAPDYYTDLPGAVLPAGTAARHHLATHRGGVVLETTRPPTAGELAAANARALAAQLEAAPATLPAELTVGAVPAERGRDYGPMFVVLAVVSGLVTLAASTVAVGLATSEMRDDLSTLAATGAGPGLRRRIAGVQAGLIVGIGVLLGVVAGIAPAAGMVAFRGDLQWRVPWLPLAVTVLVAPLLAIAGTALLTRPRLVLVRRIE